MTTSADLDLLKDDPDEEARKARFSASDQLWPKGRFRSHAHAVLELILADEAQCHPAWVHSTGQVDATAIILSLSELKDRGAAGGWGKLSSYPESVLDQLWIAAEAAALQKDIDKLLFIWTDEDEDGQLYDIASNEYLATTALEQLDTRIAVIKKRCLALQRAAWKRHET